ncbi:MAG: hypothetical protein CM15mP49_16700 [Actinomycetota bacterium]|nr:MAG: hypothetical protein CM15mP49_16700 [Actinomycetota bacterium]
MAGGLLPEFLGVHFENIDKGLINAGSNWSCRQRKDYER